MQLVLDRGSTDKPLTFDVGLIQLSFIPVCSPNSVSNQLSTKFCTYEHNSAYDLHRSAVLVSTCSPGFPQQYGACPVPISRSERKPEPPMSELFQTVYRPTTPIIDHPLPGCTLIIDHLDFSPTAHYAVNSAHSLLSSYTVSMLCTLKHVQ